MLNKGLKKMIWSWMIMRMIEMMYGEDKMWLLDLPQAGTYLLLSFSNTIL